MLQTRCVYLAVREPQFCIQYNLRARKLNQKVNSKMRHVGRYSNANDSRLARDRVARAVGIYLPARSSGRA